MLSSVFLHQGFPCQAAGHPKWLDYCVGFIVSICSNFFLSCSTVQVSSSWHYYICFSLHCRLQLITAELAVLVLEEPWSGAFCHCQVQGLRGSLFSKQLRKDVELNFLLPGWGPWIYLFSCLAWTLQVSDPKWKVSFILSDCRRSQVCATCWMNNRGQCWMELLIAFHHFMRRNEIGKSSAGIPGQE